MNVEKIKSNSRCAFTFVELVTVIAVIALCVLLVLPALARTKNNGSTAQCRNNLRQLASAWTMYSVENRGWLVSAYPSYAGFQGSWCQGNAASDGLPGSYVYGGADPHGITNGLLWHYIKSFDAYKCPLDDRIAPPGAPFAGKSILRTVSMNSYMAGTSFGISPQWSPLNAIARNANVPVFIKETEISKPSGIWVIVDEDPKSINESMLLVDMGGSRQFLDLPSRLHSSGYGINFADGHVENIKLRDPASLTWVVGQPGGINDWRTLTNITTAPLN